MKTSIPLVVTTKHRGVFFGYGTPSTKNTIRITDCRMCVYWDSSVKGVVGLAAKGPSEYCRIGPAAPSMILQDVTAIFEVSSEAELKWKEEPWK
jgi:hypothetical protein